MHNVYVIPIPNTMMGAFSV